MGMGGVHGFQEQGVVGATILPMPGTPKYSLTELLLLLLLLHALSALAAALQAAAAGTVFSSWHGQVMKLLLLWGMDDVGVGGSSGAPPNLVLRPGAPLAHL